MELEVRGGRLVVHPAAEVRAGWDEAFRKLAEVGDDELIATPSPAWDRDEWRW